MTATAPAKLTLEAFHARYGQEKPYFEYLDGEPIQKSMPTRLHALVQTLLVQLLYALGFDSGQEITLRLDPDFEPIPDVIAAEGMIESPYPTKPFEVVIEILSPEDPFSRVLRKCKLYSDWGIRQIIVVDPSTRIIWTFQSGQLRETETIARRGDQAISAASLWSEVDRRMPPTP